MLFGENSSMKCGKTDHSNQEEKWRQLLRK